MNGYGGGWVQQMIDIQAPLKIVLRKISKGGISLNDAGTLITLIEKIQELPKLEKDKVKDPNSAILLGIWGDMKGQFERKFLQNYEDVLDPVVNFAISKIDYDSLYKGLFSHFLGEILRRGYRFPGHNRPSSTLWKDIPPSTRERLVTSLNSNYLLYRERCKTIDEKFGMCIEGTQHKASRYEQYINRVLTDFEREVVAWER